ncbi:hypothetical protein G6F42_023693 [Rhizopus arrhizus]|nr:hypothetical protein G6F42_023693 [Rhizopus arrhizus]
MGYKTLMWNVDPTDYNVHMLKDGAQRIQRAFDDIASGKPSTLNAHNDSGFINLYQTSIGQVPKIIEALRSKGFKLSTAAECVGDKKPHASPNGDDDDDDDDDEKKKHEEEEKKKKDHDHDDDDEDDDDDDYSEDALKKIKEDSFAAAGSDSEKEQQGQQSAQQQEATSAANTITFSAAIGPILAACGILINYLI